MCSPKVGSGSPPEESSVSFCEVSSINEEHGPYGNEGIELRIRMISEERKEWTWAKKTSHSFIIVSSCAISVPPLTST